MWPLLGYIDFRCFIFLATMKNLPPVGANLTENDLHDPIFYCISEILTIFPIYM